MLLGEAFRAQAPRRLSGKGSPLVRGRPRGGPIAAAFCTTEPVVPGRLARVRAGAAALSLVRALAGTVQETQPAWLAASATVTMRVRQGPPVPPRLRSFGGSPRASWRRPFPAECRSASLRGEVNGHVSCETRGPVRRKFLFPGPLTACWRQWQRRCASTTCSQPDIRPACQGISFVASPSPSAPPFAPPALALRPGPHRLRPPDPHPQDNVVPFAADQRPAPAWAYGVELRVHAFADVAVVIPRTEGLGETARFDVRREGPSAVPGFCVSRLATHRVP